MVSVTWGPAYHLGPHVYEPAFLPFSLHLDDPVNTHDVSFDVATGRWYRQDPYVFVGLVRSMSRN